MTDTLIKDTIRKLGYLLRDYPDDKETSKIIDRWKQHEADMSKNHEKLSTSAECVKDTPKTLIERICRIIYESTEGKQSDKDWNGLWEWHMEHDTVAKGGVWSTYQDAKKILSLFQHDKREIPGTVNALKRDRATP